MVELLIVNRKITFNLFKKPHTISIWHIFASLGVIAGTSVLAWVAYQYRFTINPDGVAYMSISQHYIDGNWSAAVNAYWSPLLSWLMVPFMLLGFVGQTAFAIVNFVTAAFILLFGTYFIHRVTKSYKFTVLYFVSVLPFLILMLRGPITPDALVVAWILLFSWALVKLDEQMIKRGANLTLKRLLLFAVLLGFLGFLGYLTKLYLQPVFVVSILIFTLVMYFVARQKRGSSSREKTKKVLILGAVSLLSYVLFSMLWILPMSIKYQQVMVGSSYTYNTGVENPKGLPQSRNLLPPPHDEAVIAWEDPTYIKADQPPATGFLEKISDRIGRVYTALPAYLRSVSSLWVLIFAPVVATLALLVMNRLTVDHESFSRQVLILFGVYFTGYALLGNEGNVRYQWPMLLLGILLVIPLCKLLLDNSKGRAKSVRFAKFAILFLIPLSLFLQCAPDLINYVDSNNKAQMQRVAQLIERQNIIPDDARIASNRFGAATSFGYFLDTPSYGSIGKGNDFLDQDVQQQIEKYKIEYFLDFTAVDKNDYGSNAEIIYTHSMSQRYCAPETGFCELNVIKLSAHN